MTLSTRFIDPVAPEGTTERLLALLKLIAETPESKDTIQVWAWQAIKREVPDAQ